MAETPIAYGEITILDLLDTATYIYYADNAGGANPSANPQGKAYIGIYSGPSLIARPEKPDSNWSSEVWTGWQKYVGDSGAEGNGIKSTVITYAVSENGTTPPDFNDVEFATENGDTLVFTDVDATFKIINDFIYATYNDAVLKLIVEDEVLADVEGKWSSTIPQLEPGWYLWTKTIFTFTNGEQTISYNVSRNGADGAEGPQGAPGQDANIFTLLTSQEEILKFTQDNSIDFSPENLAISIVQTETNDVVEDLKNEKLTIKFYDMQEKEWKEYDDTKNITVGGANTNIGNAIIKNNPGFKINLNTLGLRLGESSELTFFLSRDTMVLIIYDFKVEDKDYSLRKAIPCRFGMNEDMASLSLNAKDIVQSIQSTKLKFDAEGLTIKNGGFKILGNNEEKLLFSENGNLTVKGNIYADDGYFKGIIEADSGYFKGKLEATDGTIGGLILKDGYMYSPYVVVDASNPEDYKNSSLWIDGNSGKIGAKNIILGEGAEIAKYIKLGNASIINPGEDNTKPFIQAGGEIPSLEIFADGKITLGKAENNQIIFDPSYGVDETIIELKGKNTCIFGDKFSITPDLATFNNINCSGKITTVTFEKNKVQSVGGSMIFKPRFEVENFEIQDGTDEAKKYKVSLKDTNNGEITEGNFLWLIDDKGKLLNQGDCSVTSVEDDKTIYINQSAQNIKSFILIGDNQNAIIGINSENGSILGKMPGQGLTISTYGNNTGLPELFLGNLKNLGKSEYTGYGLYSSNVFLNGSLTTKSTSNNYAGINTLSGIKATKFDGKDISNIIFWAGSKSIEDEAIKEAPFQVTEGGSVYAQKAVFEDSIFTGGSITGMDIYTARIHGNNQDAALTFYDTATGISFKTGYGIDKETGEVNLGTETFSIKNDGFYTGDRAFIKISEKNLVSFIGDSFSVENLETNNVGNISTNTALNFSKSDISCKIENEQKFLIDASGASFEDTIKYSNLMEYRKVNGGYDLYIAEQKEE